MDEHAVSPVVGIVLLIAIALLLASTVAVGITQFATLDDEADRADDLLDGTATQTATSAADTTTTADPVGPTTSGTTTDGSEDEAILVSEADPGEATGNDDNGDTLEFSVENTHDESVTVEAFAIDATDIDSGIEVNDENAAEVEIADDGRANRDGGGFAADDTRYEFIADSTEDGAVAEVGPTDDADVDIRYFEPDIGPLEVADNGPDADLTLSLFLADGSEQEFYFRRQA